MFCKQCGTQVADGITFCPKCGTCLSPDTEAAQGMDAAGTQWQADVGQQWQMGMGQQAGQQWQDGAGTQAAAKTPLNLSKKKLLIIAAAVVVILILIVAFSGKPGKVVREGYLTSYSIDVTVEEAFDNFFSDCKWKEEGDSYVIFTGGCLYMDKEVDVTIKFKVTGDSFVIESLSFNDVPQSDLMLFGLLEKVYDEL